MPGCIAAQTAQNRLTSHQPPACQASCEDSAPALDNAAARRRTTWQPRQPGPGAPAALRWHRQCNPPSSGVNSYLSSGVTIKRVSRSQIWSCSRHTVQSQP